MSYPQNNYFEEQHESRSSADHIPLAQTYDDSEDSSPPQPPIKPQVLRYVAPPVREEEMMYEKEEIQAIVAARAQSRKEFLEDWNEKVKENIAKQTETIPARNIFPVTDNKKRSDNKRSDDSFTPQRNNKMKRNFSPVHTPSPSSSVSPNIVHSNPTPWQMSPPTPEQSQSLPPYPQYQPRALPDTNLCPYCLQEPCDHYEDLEDTKQRASMYFGTRTYLGPNDIPGNDQRRRTFRTIYKEIVVAKGRGIYAKAIPRCVKAAAQSTFPMSS